MRKLKPQEVRVHRAQWNKLGGEGQSEEGQSSRGMRERERGQKVGRVPWRSKMKGEVTLDQDALRQDGVKCQSTGRATKVCRGGIMWKPPEVPIGFRMFGGGHRWGSWDMSPVFRMAPWTAEGVQETFWP